MFELDHIWSKMIDEAARKASKSGRHDVAEYLRLRATNDTIRQAGVGWLFDTVVSIAAEASLRFNHLTINRIEPHNFASGNSNIVGSRVEIHLGVRCLSVEAGWVRTPSDGIMQNGALACARISHFGLPGLGAEFRLVRTESLPSWLSNDDAVLDGVELRRHFGILTESLDHRKM